jgi:capsid assembly protease
MSHLMQAFFGQPWAMTPTALALAESLLLRWEAGERFDAAGIEAAIGDKPRQAAQRRADAVASGAPGLAVLPVHGVLAHRAYAVENTSSPLTSTERLAAELRRLAADPSVRTIVLDVDSPGGSVFGVQELADAVWRVRATGRRVVAVANNTAASGAYWVASQADEIVITPSGMVGSIGVIVPHVDRSKAYEAAGVRREFVTAGRYKAEGHEEGPLRPETRANLQQMVDTYYSAFTRAVASGRGVSVDVVRGPAFAQGRMVVAADAVAAGMADAVATLEATLKRHAAGGALPVGAARRQLDARLAAIAIAQLS